MAQILTGIEGAFILSINDTTALREIFGASYLQEVSLRLIRGRRAERPRRAGRPGYSRRRIDFRNAWRKRWSSAWGDLCRVTVAEGGACERR
jgi:hypothetical protein